MGTVRCGTAGAQRWALRRGVSGLFAKRPGEKLTKSAAAECLFPGFCRRGTQKEAQKISVQTQAAAGSPKRKSVRRHHGPGGGRAKRRAPARRADEDGRCGARFAAFLQKGLAKNLQNPLRRGVCFSVFAGSGRRKRRGKPGTGAAHRKGPKPKSVRRHHGPGGGRGKRCPAGAQSGAPRSRRGRTPGAPEFRAGMPEKGSE